MNGIPRDLLAKNSSFVNSMNFYKLMTWVAGIKTKFHFVPLLLMSTLKVSMDVSSFFSTAPEKITGHKGERETLTF